MPSAGAGTSRSTALTIAMQVDNGRFEEAAAVESTKEENRLPPSSFPSSDVGATPERVDECPDLRGFE